MAGEKLVGGAVGGGGVRETERECSGPLYPTNFTVGGRAGGRAPAVDCGLLARKFEGEMEGKRRGGTSGRGFGSRFRSGVTRGKWETGAVITGKKRLRVDDGSDRWVPSVSEKKETEGKRREGVPGCCWADCSWAPGLAQLAVFPFYSSFFLF
jgi:hypothetical protein